MEWFRVEFFFITLPFFKPFWLEYINKTKIRIILSKTIVNLNERTVQEYINKIRPPVEIRDKLDIGYRYDKGVIEIFEIRPLWTNPNKTTESSVAKIKYVKTQKKWKLYWMKASGKWQSYEPFPESSNLMKLLSIVDKDIYGCFYG